MTRHTWSEAYLAEEPAAELLQSLGYTFVAPDQLDDDRESVKEAVLARRLLEAVHRLNPWISDANAKRAIRALTSPQAVDLVEANATVHAALVHTVAVAQDIGDGQGKKHHNVKFIDFDDPRANDLVVTRQYRVAGAKHDIIPDIAVFVNGIPIVVIECKSPTTQNPLAAGIEDMLRYQEAEDRHRGLGAPRLFQTVQVLAVVCQQQARYATVGTPASRWAEWKVPFPLTLDELQARLGRIPTPQDVMLAGIMRPDNLLDLIQNYVVFEAEQGRTVRKTARYQQFMAVTKAVDRVTQRGKGDRRGGIVWHTQGSGKSLTMLWFAVKLRRLAELANPTIVIVTDRTDLDDQISGTFHRCGFPNPVQASTVAHLRRMLRAGPGQTITTTVQKFQSEPTKRPEVLTEEANAFVLVDEAHRTQYKVLAANMRAMLPNACFVAFTGTPIDQKSRSTLRTFGPYIDTYTIEQSVADGATVPIYYESRQVNMGVADGTIDQVFDRVFADQTEADREAIKARYATKKAIAGVPDRVRLIALNITDHYERYIRPNGFKAQVVAESQEAAVAYLKAIRELEPQGYTAEVVISADRPELEEYRRTKAQERKLIERFRDERDPLSILVVCDKLLTGFDAPVEQVMYLDANLREHTLLQAIARVNRPAEGKDYGLVVDYWGVSQELQDALGIFAPSEVANAMVPLSDELPRLDARHRMAMRFFDRVDRNDLEACVRRLEPEDVRTEFDLAFRRFAQTLEMILPDPAGLAYVPDLQWLGRVRNAARVRYRDDRLDLRDAGRKVWRLISDYVRASGVEQLLEPVSIFSERFEEELAKLPSAEARASEMEHAIRHEITVRLDENPVFYESLRDRLNRVIDDWRQERIDGAQQLQLLEGITSEIRTAGQRAEQLGLTEDEFAFQQLLADEADLGEASQDGADGGLSSELAREVVGGLRELAVIDWARKDDVQREMRRHVKRLLRASGVAGDALDPLALKILDLARARLAR